MAQHDYSIANQTAANLRTDLNNVLAAIVSNNSGATAPTDTFANMFWYDTTANILKMRNEADDAWISLGYLDQTADAFRILDDTQVVNTSGTQTGLLGDQATATWEDGTGTTESLVSPAKIKAAIDALADVTTALDDLAAGNAGAPRLHGASASPAADADTTAGLPALTVSASSQSIAADVVNYTGSFSDVSTSSTGYVSAGTVTIQRLNGTIRFQARQSSDTSDTQVKLERNGTSVYQSPVTPDGAVIRTVDVSATQDDVFEWFIRRASSGSAANLDSFLIGGTDYYVRLGVPTPASLF